MEGNKNFPSANCKVEEEKGKSIFLYFFILGLDISELVNHDIEKIKEKNPKLLCEYWNQKEDEKQHEILHGLIRNDNLLLTSIFPFKADYLISLDYSKDLDELEEKETQIYQEYAIQSKEAPKDFFNYFSYKYSAEDYFEWNVTCRICYEVIKVIDDATIYAAKAFVLVTNGEYYGLSKNILNEIWQMFKEETKTPIEPFILSIFSSFKASSDEPTLVLFKDETLNENTIKTLFKNPKENTYQIKTTPLLPPFDINLGYFFTLFKLNDLFIFGDHFFGQHSVLITSNFPEILFPIYETFLSLLTPLVTIDLPYSGKLISFNIARKILLQDMIDTTVLAYCNILPYKTLEEIAKKRGKKLLIIQIINKEKVNKICIDSRNRSMKKKEFKNWGETLLGKFFKQQTPEFQNMIQQSIETVKKQYNTNRDLFFKSEESFNLRKYFFTLMIRFLSKLVTRRTIYKDNELTTNIDINYDLQKFDISSSSVNTHPLLEIIYNQELNKNPKSSLFKARILIDELLKILEMEKENERVYFDLEKTVKGPIMTISIQSLKKDLEKKKIYYLNFYQKHFLRKGLNEEKEFQICKDKNFNYFIKYTKFNLYFQLFHSKAGYYEKKESDYMELYQEFQVYLNLFESNTIPFKDDKEYAAAAIGIGLGLIGLYQVQNKKSISKIEETVSYLMNFIKKQGKYLKKCYVAFSLLFEIITSNGILLDWIPKFFEFLQVQKIQPTISIRIKNNKKDFERLRETCNNVILDFNFISGEDLSFSLSSTTIDNKKSEKGENNNLKHPKYILIRLIKVIILRKGLKLKNINNFYSKWYDDLKHIAHYAINYFNMPINI